MNDNNNPERIEPVQSPGPDAPVTPPLAAGWERATLEKLAFAALEEQKSTRRWKTFVRLAWLGFFIALVWLAMHRGSTPSSVSSPHTALVEIRGEI